MFNPITATYFAFPRADALRAYHTAAECGVPFVSLIVKRALWVWLPLSLGAMAAIDSEAGFAVAAWALGPVFAASWAIQRWRFADIDRLRHEAIECALAIEMEFGPQALSQMVAACQQIEMTDDQRQLLQGPAENLAEHPIMYFDLLESAYLEMAVYRYQTGYLKQEVRETALLADKANRRLASAIKAFSGTA